MQEAYALLAKSHLQLDIHRETGNWKVVSSIPAWGLDFCFSFQYFL